MRERTKRAAPAAARVRGVRMGKKDRDEWIVKCPKCGRIRESCRHVSREDRERLVRLLKGGGEIYQAGEDGPEEGGHVHEPAPRTLAHVVKPRFSMEDLVLAPATREALE